MVLNFGDHFQSDLLHWSDYKKFFFCPNHSHPRNTKHSRSNLIREIFVNLLTSSNETTILQFELRIFIEIK